MAEGHKVFIETSFKGVVNIYHSKNSQPLPLTLPLFTYTSSLGDPIVVIQLQIVTCAMAML